MLNYIDILVFHLHTTQKGIRTKVDESFHIYFSSSVPGADTGSFVISGLCIIKLSWKS